MATKTVNRPTDVKVKEADINSKLQLYGIATAFANGKVPSNKQIDIALNSALASRPLANPSKRLSPEGQKLVADLRDVIEKAKILILSKNEGNLLQDFIWQTQHVGSGDATVPNAPIDKSTAQQHGNEALDGLRTLGTLIISNGQFRKLLNDAVILLRDVAGDAAQKAANRVNPSEDELNQIDRPADDNTWHDVPDMSRDSIRNQMKQRYNEQKPFGRGDLQKAAGDATQAGHPGESRDPASAADLAVKDQQQGTDSGVNAQQGLQSGMQSLRDQASTNVPDETKDRARDYRDRTKNYFQTRLPKERRDQAIFRLKKMVVEIQGHQDYQNAIDTLLHLAETYQGHSKNLTQQAHGSVKGAHTDNSLQMAEADLKTLIERFANNSSFDDVIDSINAIYRDADNDQELKNWFREMDAYIRRCLKEQGYIMQDSATDEWNRLYDRGHELLRERYRGHTDRVVDELKSFANEFDRDPQNKAFGESLRKLFMDLGNDENGKPAFKPHLLKDLSEVIIPAFFENVRYVPVPRIEYTDPMMDAIVENLVIESDNLAPNVFELASDNYWRWARKRIPSKNKNKVMMSVSGVQMDLKDVSYYIKKKQGFPSITDKGVCDITLAGDGFSFKVAMETADEKDRAHFFKITKVDVKVKNLKIKMKTSSHKLLFNIFKPLLLAVVRPALQKVLEKQIKDNVQQLDALFYKVHQEVQRAEADARRNPDPENVQNIYQRYAAAVNKQVMQGKQKGQQATADKKVNVAVTQHESIFKDISLPGGISTKATEYKELARKGDKWESPVFSIGSAKETSGLPASPSVTRRGGQRTNVGNTGYQSSTADPYSSSNGTAGFSNQVNQAFDRGTDNYKLNDVNGNARTGLGNTNAFGATNNNNNTHTTLGANNPVLTGSA